jgi:hypothetical protein
MSQPRPPDLLPVQFGPQDDVPPRLTGTGFACQSCGSPSILLPHELDGQALVICDRCRHPVGTLAAFRESVGRLLAGTRHCEQLADLQLGR